MLHLFKGTQAEKATRGKFYVVGCLAAMVTLTLGVFVGAAPTSEPGVGTEEMSERVSSWVAVGCVLFTMIVVGGELLIRWRRFQAQQALDALHERLDRERIGTGVASRRP